jgi:D-psicose/D-tagatose/L-ribulose 3-epimerase
VPETFGLAVSNIAWEPSEDDAIAEVLRREGVAGVEIAPTKWRERPYEANASDVASYRRYWEDRGLRVVALQALLFGRGDLQLFADDRARAQLGDYLRQAIDFAAALGAHALVFGSPKNRVRGSMELSVATEIATTFFRDLAVHAQARGTRLCIEANPPQYGCDFVTTTAEAIALCRAIDHPGIRVNVDLGGMTMSGEQPSRLINDAGGLIGHVHASEPQLAEIGAAADHASAGRALVDVGYEGWVSVEMRAAGDNVAAVERAVKKTILAYRSQSQKPERKADPTRSC